jgi:hypothetical protein
MNPLYSCTSVSRRSFLVQSSLWGATRALSRAVPGAGGDRNRHFTVTQRNGRWWFSTPDGAPFFSLGLNHIDAAPLRYLESGDIWWNKYGNRMERWLKEAVRPDLLAWGFNSVGWVQEVVTSGPTNCRHSPSFTFEEYQWLDLPYCHQLPFADFHQWEMETRHPDFFSREFEDWCDYVARNQCARMAADPQLIGYFYLDCPTWVHVRPGNKWKGPLFDPEKLKSAAGRAELHQIATRYYQITHDAIRRYDRHHLILGDRYEANAPLPDDVLLAARPYVDLFSFQHFGPPERIRADLARFAALTGKPVLLADSSGGVKLPDGTMRNDPVKYRQTLLALREVPACVGFHLCGAYLRNRIRKRGLRGPDETPDQVAIDGFSVANREMSDWVRQQTSARAG